MFTIYYCCLHLLLINNKDIIQFRLYEILESVHFFIVSIDSCMYLVEEKLINKTVIQIAMT